jgi:hypothetical protein
VRRYSTEEEQRIRLQARLRSWGKAGLLDAGKAERLHTSLAVPLRRTGTMLRGGLALFTLFASAAAVGLVLALFDIDEEATIAVVAALAASACLAGADWLVARYRLYRHGVEEALAVQGVLLAAVSAGTAVLAVLGSTNDRLALIAALAAGAAGGAWVYRRFGYVYASVAAMFCLAVVPFQLRLGSSVARLLSAAVLAAAFVAVRRIRLRYRDDFPGDDAAIVRAAALVGAYLVLNLFLLPSIVGTSYGADRGGWFKWTTYALVWAIPGAGLWFGVREKDRWLIDAALATGLGSIVTNKLYLGLPRETWDPMILGIVLIGAAVAVRRWLASGPGSERAGFTTAQLSADDIDTIRVAGVASAGIHPAHDLASERPHAGGFEGGRSGGAGGGAGF